MASTKQTPRVAFRSGSWRLDNLSLKVIHGPLNTPTDLEATPELKFNGLQYTFDKINVLLGEDGASVVQAKPVTVTDLSGISLSDLQEGQLSSESTASSFQQMKEDGLKEYALKYSAGGDKLELTPVELFVGAAGFLSNKVSVLLAAFKPLQSNLKTDEDRSGD
ncbi:hypothetical protein ABZP36_008554 [Zizania latifolia]